MRRTIISILLAITVHAYAQAQSGTAGASPAPVTPDATNTLPDQNGLDALKLQQTQLHTRIALVQDTIATYKSWLGHPLSAVQRQEINDRIEKQKQILATYEAQMAALLEKIKAIDPTAAPVSGASSPASGDPNWPFKH